MNPVAFPQANCVFGPPDGLEESQVQRIHAYKGQIASGSCDGLEIVIVAWKPTAEEIADLNAGAPIFLECIGGLPPHLLTTKFERARNPA